MPANLTDEQSAALTTRDVSIALSAGAGCGKTFVLTERFLSHVAPTGEFDSAEAARLNELLAITFTDAAAREMRTRIRKRCQERLEEASEEAAANWLRLLRSIDTARISTIHSFCTSLLRRHAVAAGLDPSFGVFEQGAADVLVSDVIDDVLRRLLANRENLVLDLAAEFGLSRLKESLQTFLRARQGNAATKWRDCSAKDLVTKWREFYEEKAPRIVNRAIAEVTPIEEVLDLLRNVSPPASKPKFVVAKAVLLDLLPELQSGELKEGSLKVIAAHARVQTICTAKDWPSQELYDAYGKACAELRKQIERHELKQFDEEAALAAAITGLNLLQLAKIVGEEYAGRKQILGSLDFDDLLVKAHELLKPENEALREEVSGELRAVLVDEFQDTDRVQVELIQAVCGAGFDAGRLFFVGDSKQSIYRFRGAQPRVFRNLREDVEEKGRLRLSKNFRAQPGVLHFVNALFVDALDDYEPLRPHRDKITAEPIVEFLWAQTRVKSGRVKGAADAARRMEADWIARRLSGLIHSVSDKLVVDKATQQARAVKAGDVAILFRALSDVQVYEEALRKYGLDYYLVGGHAFYAQQEIFDVLNLLRAVASPADEISLAGVLRSPFFSLEDETLYWLVEAGGREQGAGKAAPRTNRLDAGLFKELPAELSESERAKALFAADTIGHLRSIKDRAPIARLLQEALTRTGYDAVLLAEFLGHRKLANLHKLLERARAADQGGTMELDGFITQLSQFIANQPKESMAATAAETSDVIRLMTIHQAKGLEFPLVIVPDLDRQPMLRTPSAALDEELGPVFSPASDDETERTATGIRLFAARERIEELEERKRLLYVACTRAADYLILTSSLESCDELKSDWMKLLAARFDLASGELRRQLPEGYERPQVRVTLMEPAVEQGPAGTPRGPDLLNVLEAAQQLADSGDGERPPHVGPIAMSLGARRQYSFSQLSGELMPVEETDDLDAEGDLENGEVATAGGRAAARRFQARGIGTLVHDVLERIHPGDKTPPGEIRAWCEHLAPLHVADDEAQAAKLAAEMVERLFASPRGRELARAAEIHRELEFLLAWPLPANGRPQETAAAARYLRGYIDCLYKDEQGAWRIIDYKSNNLKPADIERVAKQYEMQIYVYAMAAERALGVSPVELELFFLRTGKDILFPWNDDARERCRTMVDDAMRRLTAEPPVPSPSCQLSTNA